MGSTEMVMSWLLWHQAVRYLQQDLPQVESMELRFPLFAGWIIRQIGSKAYAKEQQASKALKANRIRILKEKLDEGELFIIWSHQGNTDIFRISEGKLRSEVQKKVNELILDYLPERKDDLSPH